jgi:hypothetical protein
VLPGGTTVERGCHEDPFHSSTNALLARPLPDVPTAMQKVLETHEMEAGDPGWRVLSNPLDPKGTGNSDWLHDDPFH